MKALRRIACAAAAVAALALGGGGARADGPADALLDVRAAVTAWIGEIGTPASPADARTLKALHAADKAMAKPPADLCAALKQLDAVLRRLSRLVSDDSAVAAALSAALASFTSDVDAEIDAIRGIADDFGTPGTPGPYAAVFRTLDRADVLLGKSSAGADATKAVRALLQACEAADRADAALRKGIAKAAACGTPRSQSATLKGTMTLSGGPGGPVTLAPAVLASGRGSPGGFGEIHASAEGGGHEIDLDMNNVIAAGVGFTVGTSGAAAGNVSVVFPDGSRWYGESGVIELHAVTFKDYRSVASPSAPQKYVRVRGTFTGSLTDFTDHRDVTIEFSLCEVPYRVQ